MFFFLMIRRPPRATQSRSSAASDVYKRQCETCITRCPNNVDIARMMDVLRQMAIEKGVAAKEANVLKFHEAFLSSIKFGGRVHEMLMTVHYKLKSGDLFGDVDIAPSLFLKGKLSLLPPRTKDLKSVKNIFEKTQN